MPQEDFISRFIAETTSYEAGVDKLVQVHRELAKATQQSARDVDKNEKALVAAGKGAKSAAADSEKLTQANQRQVQQLPQLRYALYDVASTYGILSGAMLAVGGLALKTGADFESQFTRVERTSGAAGVASDRLRKQFVELSTQIPLTFDELTSLGARGAQVGILRSELSDFTEVIAQFVATSDTVTLDQAVESFGRLSNLTGDRNFDRLASSITLVGVNAAATEAQIIRTTQELAPLGTAAGLSSDEIIGLSAAVASLGQAPERSRSAFETLTRVVDRSIAGLSDKLPAFASLLNMTEQETASLWRTDPAQFIQSFSEALGATEDLTTTFDALGISERRATQVFRALAVDARNSAGGVSVLSRAFADSSQGYRENTELARQYSLIQDDLSSQLVMLKNSFQALIDAGVSEFIPTLAGLIKNTTDLVNGLREAVDEGNSFAGFMARFGVVASIAVGLLFAYRSALALTAASTIALRTATASLGGALGLRTLGSLVLGMGAYKTATDNATVATSRLRVAFLAFARATIVLAILGTVTQLVYDFRGSMQFVHDVLVNVAPVVLNVGNAFLQTAVAISRASIQTQRAAIQFLQTVPLLGQIANAFGALDAGIANLSNLDRQAASVGRFGDALVKVNPKEAFSGFQNWIDTLPGASDSMSGLGGASSGLADVLPDVEDGAYGAAGGLGDMGDSAKGAAQEVRTLVDYANDLRGVIDRAFDIRFGSSQAADNIASQFIKLREEAEESAKRVQDIKQSIRELRADLQGLTADRAVKQYFLGIAQAYGDTLRAGQLQAELADIDAKIADKRGDVADKTKELKKETDSQSKSTAGNSKAAIENRKTLEGLVSAYQDQIVKLAESGASTEELKRRTAQLKAEFIAQATQLGYNRNEVLRYAQGFNDVRIAINNIPRNVTVSANVNPALQALNEFKAQLDAKRRDAANGIRIGNVTGDGRPAGVTNGTAYGQGWGQAVSAQRRIVEVVNKNVPGGKTYQMLGPNGRYGPQFFAKGGYTGNGGKHEPKGIVHGGEFVFTKKAVNNAGIGNLYGMMRAMESGRGYATGGVVSPTINVPNSGGSRVVELSAFDRRLLAKAGNVALEVDGKRIAGTVDRVNRSASNRGSY